MSTKGFSISINERSLGGSVVEDSIEALLLGGVEIGMFSRIVCSRHTYAHKICIFNACVVFSQVLNNSQSYDEAVHVLSTRYIAAPAYYIVAGTKPNEGAVITRDRNVLSDLWQLNVSSSDPNSWYILETNYVRTYVHINHIICTIFIIIAKQYNLAKALGL